MLLNASGCLDALIAPDVARAFDAYVTKTVTLRPRVGNPPARIAEVENGMLNSIGLANPGIEAFLRDHLPRLARLEIPLWVSVGGSSAADYAELCGCLDARPDVSVVELNVSCPNVESMTDTVAAIVASARRVTAKPLYVKLAPDPGGLTPAAIAAERAGADGLTLVNTLRGLVLDERTLRPRLGTAAGGLSGPALKPVALAAVFECARATTLPIVGVGGITTGRDALELLAAGAHAVALGTILFADPTAPGRIRQELEWEATAAGVASLDDARGLAHREHGHAEHNPQPEVENPGPGDFARIPCKSPKNISLDHLAEGASIARHGGQDAGAGAGAVSRPADGGAEAGE